MFIIEKFLEDTNIINDTESFIFICDSDRDDLNSLCILIAQHYHKKINLIGIIGDNGFLEYPLNISILSFWLHNILDYHKIPIYYGMTNTPNYLSNRYFPKEWSNKFIDIMKKKYNYSFETTNISHIKSYKELIFNVKNYRNNSINIISTGTFDVLSKIIDEYPWFNMKVKKIYSMIGNYSVPGNVVPTKDFTNPNSEYNAYLNPLAFQNSIDIFKNKLEIIPLDCTDYAPLNRNIIESIKKKALNYIPFADKFIKNIYIRMIEMFELSITVENLNIYMWDIVACLIALKYNINSKYIYITPTISNTGTIMQYHMDKDKKLKLYNYLDINMLNYNIIQSIFI